MADTCGTLVKAASVLKENGAKAVLALVTHGILSGKAIENLNGSVLEALICTNTVPLGDKIERVSFNCTFRLLWMWKIDLPVKLGKITDQRLPYLIQCPKIRVIDISPTIAEAIRRTHNGESVSYLFNHAPV